MPSDSESSHSSLLSRIGPLADAKCIVLCLDDKGRILFLNPFGRQVFGYSRTEIIGSKAAETILPNGVNIAPGLTDQTGNSQSGRDKDDHQLLQCRRKDGDPAWIIWSSQTLEHASEKIGQHLWIGHEITAHIGSGTEAESNLTHGDGAKAPAFEGHQASDERRGNLIPDHGGHHPSREIRDRYRLFSEVTTEGILFHDNGIAIEANEAFVDLVGSSHDQIIGKNIIDQFVSATDRDWVRQIIASNEELLYEATACSSGGRAFPVEIRSRPGNLGGRPCRVVCVRDISHRKKTERQLIQSQKMEAIGTLASGVAHDFNNMLAGIQGNVEVIRHQLSPKSLHQKPLKLIGQIVERGAKLTGQILGYARSGQSELTDIKLNHLVEETLDMFGSANKKVEIQTRLNAGTPEIQGDPTQIEQVLLNLMINAIQAMPMGGTLTIETRPTVLSSDIKRPYEIVPGDYARIVVQDTGHGMDPKTQKLIFEPFFTTKAKGEGTGLGLASTYGIIKNHKGYIDVTSEPGVGSRFSILLPASLNAQKVPPEEIAVEKEADTILMVDDETDFLLLGHQMLGLLGYRPLTAKNCEEALSFFKQSGDKIHLVIMDMIMPDSDVDDTIRKIRQINSSVPILLSSGHSQDGEIGRRLMQLSDGFIQKPFRLASLSNKIKELIGSTENEG